MFCILKVDDYNDDDTFWDKDKVSLKSKFMKMNTKKKKGELNDSRSKRDKKEIELCITYTR